MSNAIRIKYEVKRQAAQQSDRDMLAWARRNYGESATLHTRSSSTSDTVLHYIEDGQIQELVGVFDGYQLIIIEEERL